MALLDLLGRRWALRVVWELRDGALTARRLRDACDDASPTVLNARLQELREAGLIMNAGAGYQLTEAGLDLLAAFEPLYRFADRWGGGRGRKPDGDAGGSAGEQAGER
jgi:DNA-binding HxlR family transcriptional regulator